MPSGASALNRTLQQLYAAEERAYSGGASSGAEADARLGNPGHIMYSDEPPMVEGLSDDDSFESAFTQGKGVMVSSGAQSLHETIEAGTAGFFPLQHRHTSVHCNES